MGADTGRGHLTTELTRADGAAVLAARGEIDHQSYARFAGHVLDALAGSEPTVIVDLSGVTYCNSSGLKVLHHAGEHAAARGARLWIVVGDNSVLLRMLQRVGLVARLQVVTSRADIGDAPDPELPDTAHRSGRPN